MPNEYFSQSKKLHICIIVHDHNNCVSKTINQSTIDMLIAAPLRISENNNDDEWQYVRNKDVLCL